MPATASAVLVVGDDEFFNWDITCDSVEQNIIRGDLKEPSCLVVGLPRKLIWSIRRRARLVHEMEYLTVAVIEMVCSTLVFRRARCIAVLASSITGQFTASVVVAVMKSEPES
jgi:hypothetical protein